jgi:cyclophilin family peptidyl-prolyl cis-trans isomerase
MKENEEEFLRVLNFLENRYHMGLLSIFMQQNNPPTVELITNHGSIILELSPLTPKTTENFVKLVQSGYYNGVTFHRVIADFMIQGGDPSGTGMWGKSIWWREFEDEFHPELTHVRWVISMANAGRNTNGSQFFIVTQANAGFLNNKHTVFGKVVSGYSVVQSIEITKTDRNDRPIDSVVITEARVIEGGGI